MHLFIFRFLTCRSKELLVLILLISPHFIHVFTPNFSNIDIAEFKTLINKAVKNPKDEQSNSNILIKEHLQIRTEEARGQGNEYSV